MPRGIPNKKQEPADGAAKSMGRKKGNGVNKMQCVREALAELGNEAQPKDIQDLLKRKFGLDMNTKFISTYKSSILREAAKKGGAAPKASSPAAAPPKTSLKVAGTNGGISVEDIRAVKGLVDKIGAGTVKELADVLSE
jgi:hypothetical protein